MSLSSLSVYFTAAHSRTGKLPFTLELSLTLCKSLSQSISSSLSVLSQLISVLLRCGATILDNWPCSPCLVPWSNTQYVFGQSVFLSSSKALWFTLAFYSLLSGIYRDVFTWQQINGSDATPTQTNIYMHTHNRQSNLKI